MTRDSKPRSRHHGVLRRLARDTRGNAIIMIGAMLLPLLAFSGSAFDMARLYVVKTRAQHACDAGALAARKAMTDFDGSKPGLDDGANSQAQAFFATNFPSGWMNASIQNPNGKPVFTKAAVDYNSANVVNGTVTLSVPMKLMSIFGIASKSMKIDCQARADMMDVDTVFVLDMSNSMGCTPAQQGCADNPVAITYSDGVKGYYQQEASTGSKLEGVRQAVLAYDTAIRQGADASTNFRYGFVPYASNVNIGKILYNLNQNYIVSGNVAYQSRTTNHNLDYAVSPQPSADSIGGGGMTSDDCTAGAFPNGSTLATSYSTGLSTYVGNASTPLGYAAYVTFKDGNGNAGGMWNKGRCFAPNIKVYRITWNYRSVQWPVGDYVLSGIPSKPIAPNPTRVEQTSVPPQRWHGCIEEVGTSVAFPPNPDDLNPDSVGPWRPMWPEAEWLRAPGTSEPQKDDAITSSDPTAGPGNDSKNFMYNYAGTFLKANFFNACGAEARRVATMSHDALAAYVGLANASGLTPNQDFKPSGRTYHDAGLRWGARLLSPTGIFGNDTAHWPGRPDPVRRIVFLTDGNLAVGQKNYDEYGVEFLDGRVTGTNPGQNEAKHRARFVAACNAFKNIANAEIQIVLFNTANNFSAADKNAMLTCAGSASNIRYVQDNAGVIAAFTGIATGYSRNRVSQ